MKKLSLSLTLSLALCWAASAGYPGEHEKGKCMTFGESYARNNPGTTLLVMMDPLNNSGHIVVRTADGGLLDNLFPVAEYGIDVQEFYIIHSYRFARVIDVIDYDHQTPKTQKDLAWLRSHEQAQ